jgi:hypothetical protein
VDNNAAYPKAIAVRKKDVELWRRSRLRQVKYLNNIVEQDHRNVKRLTRPDLGFGGFLDGPMNTGRLRGDGTVKERAGSEHQRQRHHGSSNIHRWTIQIAA